jgi:triacylglycerol esterase/lipase EstA (alpha/beta hydrolase family)
MQSPLPRCIGSPPVVLIGGVASAAGGWKQWTKELDQAGIHAVAVKTPRLGFSTIQADLNAVDDAVRGALLASGAKTVHLVGHSKGGITAVEYLRQNPDVVEGVVTIASPHKGSQVATAFSSLRNNPLGRRLIPQLATDLAHDSKFIANQRTVADRVTTIHASSFDGIISTNSGLDGASMKKVDGSTAWSARHDALRTSNRTVRDETYAALGILDTVELSRNR